jgi:hypothetical protein
MTDSMKHYPKHLHSLVHRGLYCLLLIGIVMTAGTVGMHAIEHFSYIDAFYFTSMIATGQGPAPSIAPVTCAGKLFTCVLAFISVGTMVASLGFVFGPFFGRLFKTGAAKLEEEIEHLKRASK